MYAIRSYYVFHEFGHGLHGLLSNVTYNRLAGTNVLRDFVELPSQINEHWALTPEILKKHAVHAATGQPMPDELIALIKKSEHFNHVITSYSIHYTKLYDITSPRSTRGSPSRSSPSNSVAPTTTA